MVDGGVWIGGGRVVIRVYGLVEVEITPTAVFVRRRGREVVYKTARRAAAARIIREIEGDISRMGGGGHAD